MTEFKAQVQVHNNSKSETFRPEILSLSFVNNVAHMFWRVVRCPIQF